MVYPLKSHHGPGVNCIVIGEKVMAIDKKDRPWDGRSRPSDDLYRKEFDRIFGNKSRDDDRDHVNDDHANKKDKNEKTRR